MEAQLAGAIPSGWRKPVHCQQRNENPRPLKKLRQLNRHRLQDQSRQNLRDTLLLLFSGARQWPRVIGLAVTSISEFWITSIRPRHYILIHLLSLATMLALVNGIRARRRGDIRNHKKPMITAYLGLTSAGLAALLPPRVLARMLFS